MEHGYAVAKQYLINHAFVGLSILGAVKLIHCSSVSDCAQKTVLVAHFCVNAMSNSQVWSCANIPNSIQFTNNPCLITPSPSGAYILLCPPVCVCQGQIDCHTNYDNGGPPPHPMPINISFVFLFFARSAYQTFWSQMKVYISMIVRGSFHHHFFYFIIFNKLNSKSSSWMWPGLYKLHIQTDKFIPWQIHCFMNFPPIVRSPPALGLYHIRGFLPNYTHYTHVFLLRV